MPTNTQINKRRTYFIRLIIFHAYYKILDYNLMCIYTHFIKSLTSFVKNYH